MTTSHRPSGSSDGRRFEPHLRPRADISGLDIDADETSAYDGRDVGPELVRARATLFDAVAALEDHIHAFTLIGAQAVYEHTKHYGAVPPTLTNDGDMGVDPDSVCDHPGISEALRQAGFEAYRDRPGIWLRPDGSDTPPSVDLLSPEAKAGRGTRSTRIDGQEKSAVGRAAGLELAMLDRELMVLDSLNPDDRRQREMYVAGPAAILCAKAYKLAERVADARRPNGRNRIKAKDAGDVWRLMATTDPKKVRATFAAGEDDPQLGPAIAAGRDHLVSLFSAAGPGYDLAALDLADSLPEQQVHATIDDWIAGFTSA
jgi:hypothetical protein